MYKTITLIGLSASEGPFIELTQSSILVRSTVCNSSGNSLYPEIQPRKPRIGGLSMRKPVLTCSLPTQLFRHAGFMRNLKKIRGP